MTIHRSLPVALALFAGSCLPAREREEEPAAPPPTLLVRALTCEHRTDPAGIDARVPRLGWKLAPRDPEARGLRQSAYQVLVARDEARLAAGSGDLWDSGSVESDDTLDVEYGGLPLASGTRCFWKVRVWDRDSVASGWSPVARFSLGCSRRRLRAQ
jgi:alpha-L-rhamnosidase